MNFCIVAMFASCCSLLMFAFRVLFGAPIPWLGVLFPILATYGILIVSLGLDIWANRRK